MGKYISLLKYELKTITRDSINLTMLLSPLVLLTLGAFVFPTIFGTVYEGEPMQVVMILLLIIIIAFAGYLISAMATFLLLEHKDECTLNTIAVTPVGASGYLKFKLAYIYVLSVISTLIVIFGVKFIAGDKYAIGGVSLFDNLDAVKITAFAFVSSMFVPALTLFQSAFAKNKVEGFAFIKGTGIAAFIPALMVLDAMQGGLQYMLGVFPNFWPIKGIMLELFPIANDANLSFPLYLLIGAVYNAFIIVVTYRMFLKKTQY